MKTKTIILRTTHYNDSPIPIEMFRFKLYTNALYKLHELQFDDLTGCEDDSWQIIDMKETETKNKKGDFTNITLKVKFMHYE